MPENGISSWCQRETIVVGLDDCFGFSKSLLIGKFKSITLDAYLSSTMYNKIKVRDGVVVEQEFIDHVFLGQALVPSTQTLWTVNTS